MPSVESPLRCVRHPESELRNFFQLILEPHPIIIHIFSYQTSSHHFFLSGLVLTATFRQNDPVLTRELDVPWFENLGE